MNDNRKCFCTNCEKYVDYEIIDCVLEGNIKSITYKYNGKQAKCKICNSLVYVPEVNDTNLHALYDKYREEENIVSLSVIKELPKKYNIGKRPLSRLLNMGEITYTRFVDGDVPSFKNSELIKKLYDDPYFFNEILENNKDRITNVTYKKCKTSVNKLLKINANKINDVADYIIYRSNYDITPLAIQKLLYYVQGFYYAFYSEFIFINDCEAWKHGPVYKELYQKYKDYKYKPINKSNQFDKSKLTKKEIALIDSVIDNLGCFSGDKLRLLTHSETPWKQTRKGLSPDSNSVRIISKDLIAKYFVDVLKKYNISNPKQICKYSYRVINIK